MTMTAERPAPPAAAEHEAPEELLGRLRATLPADAFLWYNPPGRSDRPPIVILGRQCGLVGLSIFHWAKHHVAVASSASVTLTGGRSIDPVGQLGRSLEQLYRLAGDEIQMRGLILFTNIAKTDFVASGLARCIPVEVAVCSDQMSDDEFRARLDATAGSITSECFSRVRSRLYPETEFELTRLVTVEGRIERRVRRLQLDAAQEQVARSLRTGLSALSGVAGSGKSLVVAARARYLARMHEDWRVQVVCYNNSLVKYLSSLIGDERENVKVSTFHSWAREHRIWLPFVRGDEQALREEEIIRNALVKGTAKGVADAVIVDEGQDFRPSWLKLVRDAVRPGKGGLLIATDNAQSIYNVTRLGEVFPGTLDWVFLKDNYRNTQQIGEFAYATIFDSLGSAGECLPSSNHPFVPEFRLQGEPVQIVWAESWNSQADFVSGEIHRLVRSGRVSYRDIAVLYPKRSGTTRIATALSRDGVPHFVLSWDKESKDAFDLSSDTVKVMTAHSAKGLEFPVVFLFGAEATAVPECMDSAPEEDANRARVLFVAMTRATDLLYVTYTRPNLLIDRAHGLQCCDLKRFPEDLSQARPGE
jgi:hypothetical protein